MIRDAREIEDGAILRYDLCIVGAGAAGITLAERLGGHGLRIALLESGDITEDEATQDLSNGAMTGLRTWTPRTMRARLLGGTTSRWAGWCRPLGPEDFEERAWIPHSGWPIGWDDLEPWYGLAQQRLQLGDLLYAAAPVAAHAGRPLILPESDAIASTFFQYSPPVRFGPAYREMLDEADDVDVWLWANLTELHLDATLRRVDSLEVRTLAGRAFRVEADRVVLAMGGLENARILLASRSRLEEGVANSSDSVGRYFMEHPHYYNSAAWVLPRDLDLRFYDRWESSYQGPDGDLRGTPVRGVLKLSAAARASHGLPAFTAEIIPADLTSADTGAISPPAVVSLLANDERAHSVVRLTCRVEQTPNPESRITLDDASVDALGMPRMQLRWLVSDDDRSALRRALVVLGSELAANGLGRLWTPHESGLFSWNTQPGGHHMGTTRMHADPRIGVVDANLRTHDVENLYVVGASVFTTGGDANPTLTVVALAERLADHLLAHEEE